MSYTFKIIDAFHNGAMWAPLQASVSSPEYNVTEDAIPGFTVQYFEQYNSDPPITGAQKLYGQLTYGNVHPDLILSSEKMMKRMVRCFVPAHRKPVMYGCNFGFFFNGSIWSHAEGTDSDIGDGWVFILNREHPLNPRLNGCMKAAWMENNGSC